MTVGPLQSQEALSLGRRPRAGDRNCGSVGAVHSMQRVRRDVETIAWFQVVCDHFVWNARVPGWALNRRAVSFCRRRGSRYARKTVKRSSRAGGKTDCDADRRDHQRSTQAPRRTKRCSNRWTSCPGVKTLAPSAITRARGWRSPGTQLNVLYRTTPATRLSRSTASKASAGGAPRAGAMS